MSVSVDVHRRPRRSTNVCPHLPTCREPAGGASAMAWVTKRRGSDGVLHYQGRYRDPFGAKRTVGTYP